MKYCVSSRQAEDIISKADQILVLYKYHIDILKYVDKYPDKEIILNLPTDGEINMLVIQDYNVMLQGRLIVGLSYSHFDLIDQFKEKNIRYFFTFPAQNWEELRLFKKLGVCYAYLAPPLTHSLKKVKSLGVPIRAIPNIAHDPYIPYENGIVGSWIRPEDTEIYEEYIDVFDLDAVSIAQEKALFNIYKNRNWPGPLEDLIQDLKVHALNRMIPSDIGLIRTNCEQKCLIPGEKCNICPTALKLADKELIMNYRKSVQS